MITVDAMRTAVYISMSTIVSDLTDLAAIPSVSVSSHDQSEVQRSTEAVAAFLRDSGLDAEILSVPALDDTPGRPAVLVHKADPQGSPYVLPYSHHNVRSVDDPTGWDQTDPLAARRRGEWLLGRETADDKAGITIHTHVLHILASLADGELPYSATIFIKGEGEVSSPPFENFPTIHRDCLAPDVIVVADPSSWKVGIPPLTTSLRGVVQVDIRPDMLDHVLHSGIYGGPVLNVVTAVCRPIVFCHNDAGDIAMAGLVSRSQADADFPDYPETDFRVDADILDGIELSGIGDLTTRPWTKPSPTLISTDVTPLELAGNVLTPSCTARLSLRITPGQDPVTVQEALVAHLEKHVPFGGRLTITGREAGPAFDGPEVTPASEAAHWVLSAAWDTGVVNIGQGRSIPFIVTFKETLPGTQVLVTRIEDPGTRAYSENESMYLSELERIVVAEALFLARLSGVIGS